MGDASIIIKELLEKMGFGDARVLEQSNGERTKIDIQTAYGREIIGEKGTALMCFQHIARRILAKRKGTPVLLDLDINGYRKMREDIMREFARDIGEKVRLRKTAIELEPMPSYDRRIIHLALGAFPDLRTESIGEGQNRYIIVRPAQ